jgi:hypothetical protein
MGIIAKIKYTNVRFSCSSYENWKAIAEHCPLLEEIFYEFDKTTGKPAKYFIEHEDPRLRQLMSEIDTKYIGNVFDAVFSLAREIRKIIHQSMSSKKDLEVLCVWRKPKEKNNL